MTTHQPPGVVPPGGTHLFVDLFGADQLDDIRHVQAICTRAAQTTGATVLRGEFHHFGEGCGISGVILLAESHLSIHTWPENHLATIDIYVCGNCVASNAVPVLKEGFAARQMNVSEHRRGIEADVRYRIRIRPHQPNQDEHFVIQNANYTMTKMADFATSFATMKEARDALLLMPSMHGHGSAIVEAIPS